VQESFLVPFSPISRVASISTFPVSYPEPNDNGNTRHLLFVRVEADDGTVGWGEAITMFPDATRATQALVEGMAEIVVGTDPMENVATWRRIKAATWWYAFRGGVAGFALSAIDIALWDLKGKLLGQPLINLIGGAHRERLPALASTHVFDPSLEAEAERHGRYVREQGYIGVKIGMGKKGGTRLGYEHDRDVEFVRLLREAVGPDAWIMMDRGQALDWDVASAIRRVNAFEELGLKWIEEPLEPNDIRGFRHLRQHVKTLVAGGEREWDAKGFETLIATGVIDVVGVDPGRAEGITGVLRVIALVEQADVWFNAHAWSSAVNTAASIALSASTPRCLLQELKPDENPMQHELVEQPFAQRDGWIDVPRAPGLGVEVRESVLEKYRLA
jgi:D-galactarolactone cycloisomerase